MRINGLLFVEGRGELGMCVVLEIKRGESFRRRVFVISVKLCFYDLEV